jgi:hypothetical protein
MNRVTSSILFLFLTLLLSAPIAAQTSPQPKLQEWSTHLSGAAPLTIIFLGTRHYSDINPIITSLKGLQHVIELTPSLESQSRLEFVGFFTGPRRSLRADIASLIADRFTLEEREDGGSALVVTLKKITTPIIGSSY